jgi:uncharacterized membrane protein YfcA
LLVAGGVLGSIVGAALFQLLQARGLIDTTIGVLYVLMLGSIGGLMLRESLQTMQASPHRQAGAGASPAGTIRWSRRCPFAGASIARGSTSRRSRRCCSASRPGVLTVLLGVGGGFILIPAMLYLLGMPTQVVVGTSLFQILFVTASATMVHALTTKAVDIVLAVLLLLGSVVGAQIGARLAQKAKPEYLRLILAVIVLLVALFMLLGLVWRPDEIYTVEIA